MAVVLLSSVNPRSPTRGGSALSTARDQKRKLRPTLIPWAQKFELLNLNDGWAGPDGIKEVSPTQDTL